MAAYLISYDIAEKDAFEYQPLWDKLKALGAQRILYSEWIVTGGPDQTGAIYDEIAPLIQSKDRLLIQELLANAHWNKLLINDDSFRALVLQARRA